MSVNHQSTNIIKRILHYILNIGADSQDSDYIRMIKRIWYVTSVVSLPTSFLVFLFSLVNRDSVLAIAFLFSFLLFLFSVVDGAKNPNHFQRNANILFIYFILASGFITILQGGFWSSNGIIFVGLLGPLYALLFPRKGRAIALFGLYTTIVIGLAIFRPFFKGDAIDIAGFNLLFFWIGFIVIAAFIFSGMYFFVILREKAYLLLGKEKEISERLLKRIEKDLGEAAKIQKDFLPQENPHIKNFDISGTNVPCYQVGGDYYDFIPIDRDRTGIVIADVSGKGISASLLMASLRAALLTEINPDYDIQILAGHLNEFVFKSSALNSFITFFIGELNHLTGELRYINAGHIPPLVVLESGEFSVLQSSGFALGMFSNVSYESSKIRLEERNTAVLFTDGIPEARNEEQNEYSEERLRETIGKCNDLPAVQISQKILNSVQSFSAGTEQTDDITLVVIKRNSGLIN